MPRHIHFQVDENPVSHVANARARNALDSADILDGFGNTLGQSLWRAIQQCINCPAPQCIAHAYYNDGNNKGCNRIRPPENGFVSTAVFANSDKCQSYDYNCRAPDVGSEMKRVGFQCLAAIFFRYAPQRSRARDIDHNREPHYQESPKIGIYVDGYEKQSFDRFVDDPSARQQQKKGFCQGAEILDFSMAIQVRFIGRTIAHPNGK